MKVSIVCLLVIGVIVLYALARNGDVKASFRVMGAAFSIERIQSK